MKQYLDLETWPRRKQYDMFRRMDYPQVNVCSNLDITRFYPYIKTHQYPFFRTMVYLVTKTANTIPEFRYRIQEERVVEYDRVHPSFTWLTREEVFSFCQVDYIEDFLEFSKQVAEETSRIEGKVDLDDNNRDDLLYITCLPWVSFTGIVHPVHMHPVDSVPRISWGKYFEESQKLKLPCSVQVHHGLMDGIHIGKFFNRLQEMLDNPQPGLVTANMKISIFEDEEFILP